MEVGRGGVETCLYSQWPSFFSSLGEPGPQVFLSNQFGQALFQITKLFVNRGELHLFQNTKTGTARPSILVF